MTYICEKCNQEFTKKNILKKHISECNSGIEIINENKEENQETDNNSNIYSGTLQELHSVFRSCLDILRNDAEHLIGDEALHELSHFLILKQSEKHIINGSIDIYNLQYYNTQSINRYGVENFKENLEYVKFSVFAKYVIIPEKEQNIKNIFDNFLWREILSCHPKFKDVFEQGKNSNIKQSTTIKKIVEKLSEINFDNYDYDVLGEAYENIFVDAVFGAGGNKKSELGQFFTPPKVKKLLINLVNPKIKENGEIESVLDPASGTGGILNTVIKHFKKGGISVENLHEQLIKNIYGIEIKGKIFNLCLSNMLINTGEILPNVVCADSIRKFHNIKVDTIIANPPFSVTIKYDELLSSIGDLEYLNNYIPIKAGGKNSELLFLQMMIHCLNIEGRCATVMLDGQKMYGSASGYDKVREYLLRSCDLHEVISCPNGTFTSTASKTCILFFTKKKERTEVVDIIGDKRKLKFCTSHSTESVKFYNFNPETEEKQFINEVSINDIVSKKYSLNHSEYNNEEEKNNDNDDDIVYKTLGEVCETIKGIKRRSKDGKETGLYPLYYCSILGNLYLDTFDYSDEGIIINKTNGSGKAMVYYGCDNYNVGETTLHFKSNSDTVIKTKYIYYYLFNNIDFIQKYYKGANQKSIVEEDLFKIKIPIPSLEHQQEIVEFLDNLFINKYDLHSFVKYYENGNMFKLLLNKKYKMFQTIVEWQHQSTELLNQIKFFENRQKKYLYIVSEMEENIKTLGEVCKFDIGGTPSRSKNEYYENGNNLWVSVRELNGGYIYDTKEKITELGVQNSSVKLFVKDTILFSFKLSIGKTAIVGNPLYTNEAIVGILSKNNNLLFNKYLYYYLTINDFSRLGSGIFGNGSLNKKSLGQIKIPIPSLERQQEIVEYCQNNDNLIKQLEKEIENNKKQAQQFLTNVLKSTVRDEEDENTETIHEPENFTTVEFSGDEEDTQEEKNGYEETKE